MPDQKRIYFIGSNISHAITNTIHNDVAATIGYTNWRLEAIDIPDVTHDDTLIKGKLHGPKFAGAVITMPHKLAIIRYLDDVDEIVSLVGACNNIYPVIAGTESKLIGTNTDWIGIRECLLRLDRESRPNNAINDEETKSGFIVGAGGASRAAIYALTRHLSVARIYIVNRDIDEVQTLVNDIKTRYQSRRTPIPEIIHLQTPEQARNINHFPYYGIGTVPDYPPTTDEEITARDTLHSLLARGNSEGGRRAVFLDMCYKPRQTRNLVAAKMYGWVTGEGVDVVTYQLKEQWRLWAGEEEMARRARQIADLL
ncbi:shikimate 5-dehydrogenase, putative [Talaromyces stipitatus ATCC 10500]|uniref:Shikimate 5-dehydrogenase, putative n=1 Tax=Talaromyces stipitatus (strain ATCC 10500 / CBS 375.48 / QM 6759 / NRRL 1006) TaxID=441959 RepID=B8LT70_TALSN|nr:shikimate 5-dehydrogenase, putative [Talaromyces stipitatus ATCC 10500]EED23578.1 shikimate 5-dehydrogenase, putative [Talaromyces stipitatus ATCC 10500]